MNSAGRLDPRLLRLAQAAWLAGAALVLFLFLAGTVVYFNQLRQVCLDARDVCTAFDYATPAGVEQLARRGLSLDQYALLRAGIRLAYSAVPITLGFLIFARRRSEPIALLVSFFLISFGTVGEAQNALVTAAPLFRLPAALIEILGAGLLLPLFIGLFPNGRMVPRIFWVVVIFFFVSYAVVDIETPLGAVLGWVGWLSIPFGGLAAQVYRYRHVSTPVERQQTRWVLFGFALMAATIGGAIGYTILVDDSFMRAGADADLVQRNIFLSIVNFSFQFLYLSIGLAILRSRLFNIDLIIRRTLQYSLLTGMLALVYFGGVVVVQTVLGEMGGLAATSPLAIVLSTLLVAALFSPLRRRIQDFIDRRFYRSKYNAERTLDQFAAATRSEVELEALTLSMQRAIAETLHPASMSIWLAPRRQPPAGPH